MLFSLLIRHSREIVAALGFRLLRLKVVILVERDRFRFGVGHRALR